MPGLSYTSTHTPANSHPNQVPYYHSASSLPSPFLAPPTPMVGFIPAPGWTGHRSGPIYPPPGPGPSSTHLQGSSQYSQYGQPAYPPSSSHLAPVLRSPSLSPHLHPPPEPPIISHPGQASPNNSTAQSTAEMGPPASGTSPVPPVPLLEPPAKKAKRKRKDNNPATNSAPPLTGVGPSLPSSAPAVVVTPDQPAAPTHVMSTLLPPKVARTDTATDIWWFIRKCPTPLPWFSIDGVLTSLHYALPFK